MDKLRNRSSFVVRSFPPKSKLEPTLIQVQSTESTNIITNENFGAELASGRN